jgi:hypothetical protein
MLFSWGMIVHINAREWRRARIVRTSPRVGLRITTYGGCHGYYDRFDDPWCRYRMRHSVWPWYQSGVVYQYGADDYDDVLVSEEFAYERLAALIKVVEYEVNERSVLLFQIPAVEAVYYKKGHKEYPGIAALHAASCLSRVSFSDIGQTRAVLEQGKEQLAKRLLATPVMQGSSYKHFLQRAVRSLKKEYKKQVMSKREIIGNESDVKALNRLQGNRIQVERSALGSYDSLKTLVHTIVKISKDGEPQSYCLPLNKEATEWVALHVETREDVVYMGIVRYW